jgi:hypothetical protein
VAIQLAERRLVFVISRERLDLYDALGTALANEPHCEVILDRRKGERRQGERRRVARGGADRRSRQRREALIDREVSEYGWAVLKTRGGGALRE